MTGRSALSSNPTNKRAWLVLLTRSSYLPGVVILAHSLRKVKSRYPLVVVITPSLPASAVQVLYGEGLQVKLIDPLSPQQKVEVVVERFQDTWTKLAVFGFIEYEKAILLDGDTMVMRNMDELFDLPLPEDWIAANHACVCNLERSPWAPDDWREENCAYTPLSHPGALRNPTPVDASSIRTHQLLNSGLVVLTPSTDTYSKMLDFLYTSLLVAAFSFPDQDFLAHFFTGKWWPLGWQFNAIKTARHWHPRMWRDEEVRNLHYIVEKPWNVRQQDAGEDEETHGWWWNEFREWEKKSKGREAVRKEMKALC